MIGGVIYCFMESLKVDNFPLVQIFRNLIEYEKLQGFRGRIKRILGKYNLKSSDKNLYDFDVNMTSGYCIH